MKSFPLGEGGRGIEKKQVIMDRKSNYNKELKEFAKKLRKDSTPSEIILWTEALQRKKLGYTFNRQFSMKVSNKNIIVDFICRKLKLIIEIDGFSHTDKYFEDKERDSNLSELGYKVLRFSENEVKKDLDNVIRVIENNIKQIKKSIPLTPFAKGELESANN